MSDFTSPLRSMRGPFLSEAEPLQSGKITPGMGAMQAGAVSTLTGMSAGSTANDALAAERAGSPNFSALRARAGELARLSEEQAPPVRSMADINGVEDAVKFVAGGAGSMLPYIPVAIGGAVAGRILGPSALRAANPTIGMAATMYPLEKGQGVLEQYMDPVQAAQPIDRRDEVATTRALINAGLLGGAANSVLRGIAGRAARGPIFSAVEAGLPMAASTYVGQRAAAELNPERDASHDNMALADSLVLGGLLGAAGHVPSGMAHMAGKAVDAIPRPRMPERQPRAPEELGPAAEPIIPQNVADTVGEFAGTVNERVVQPGVKKAAEMFNEYKPKAEEYATKSSEFVDETLRKFNDAAKEAQDFPDFVRRAFGDKDLSDAETLAEGDKAPAYKKADGSVDEEKLFASDEPRRAKTEQYAADLLNNPNTSETVKERIRAFNGDYSSEEAQKYVGNTILGQRAGERAADAIKAFKKAATDLLSKAKGAAGKAVDGAKDSVIRKSEMSSKTQLELEKTIFGSLKNELQTQSGVVAQVPELAKVVSKLLSQGASVDDQALRAFGGFRALDALFDNPAEAVSAIAKTLGTDDLYKRTAKFRTASEDARKADSMLYKAIPQERRDVIKAKELREIGHVVDALGTIKDEKQYKTMLSALAKHVYGDEATAKAVVDFYTRNNEADLAVDSPDAKIPKMSEDVVEGEHISELEKQGLSVEKPEEQVVYSSVDEGKKRPFHASQLKKLADKLEVEQGPTGRGRVEKLSNHVIMEDGDPVATLAEIEGDIKRRIQDHKDHKEYTQGTEIQREYRANQIKDLAEQLNQIERRKGEVRNDAMLKDADPYTKAMYEAMSALQDFYVGKVQAEGGDKLAADDKFMRDAGYGYSKMTKENREKNKDQFITFEMSDGKKKVLHGPSMVRAMSKKQGTTGDDSGTAREARLLRDAVASVLARPDVVAVAGGETALHNLKFNESMSLGAARAETNKRTAEIMAANKAMREAQAALDKNYEAVRAAIAENKEAIEAGLDYLPRNKKFFAKLEAEREVLRAKIKKARDAGADEPLPDKSEKRERETQGVTDIQTELVNPEGKTRINLLDKDERPDRSTNTSPGKYERRDIPPKARDYSLTSEEEIGRQRAIGRNRAAEAKETARREAEIDKLLEGIFGKDKGEERGQEMPGTVGDPDKATPGYLKKDVDAEFTGENYTSSLHGPEENLARIEAGKKMLRDLATKHELDDAVRARVEEGLEWAVEMSKKETLTDAELAEASKRIARIVDAFGAAALDKQNKPDGWSIEEILTDSHMLRAEIFKALVPVSRKAEERAHQIIKDALGEKFESFITPFIDGSGRVAGQYMASDKGYERISLSSVISAMSWGRDADTGLVATAHHEIMHAIVTRIERQFGIDALKKLSDAAQQDRIKNQVLKAVENLGEGYKKYLLDNPEELLVETYAQWRLGNVEILPADKRLKGFFGAIKEFVRSLFDMLSQDELLQTVFDRAAGGYFKDRDFVGTNLLESMKNRRDVGMLTYDGSTGGKTTRLESRRSQEVHDELGRKGIENNYVEFSKQRPSPGRDITPEEAQEVRDYVLKTRGPRVKVVTDEFAKDIGGSGSYFKNAQERVIKIARDALNPLSTAYHESMHDFFHTLLSDKDSRRLRTDLLRAADLPYVQAQLRVLLRDHPDALKQVLDSPEERLSYMYQFWAAGHLRVSPFANTLFGKVTKWIKDVLGIVSVGDKGEAIMAAFHDGRLADPSTAGAVIADLNMKTLSERLEKLSGPLGRVAERMLTPATERLHNSSIPALKELAEMFHREPDRESGGLPFLQKRMKTGAEFTNKFQNLVENASNTDMATALKELQSMQQPTTELGRGIRKLLDEMYTYMSEAGVENSSLDMATKKVVWNPIRQVKDYFPRVWDRAIIRQRADEFKQLLMTEGKVDRAEADAVVDAITSGDGLIELSETEHHLGFTPYNSAVKERAMKFITSQNAHMFEPFQEKDLVKVMHTYIYQAAHRGEYARFFGNDGEKIKELLFRATKEGASEEEITAAAKTVRAMEGTLGAEIPGRLREVYSAVVGYENIVLLPFALFSSFIDPLGVAVRSGKMTDAAVAFKDGIKGLFQDLLRMDKDAEYEMAKTIGIISELNKLEAMGQVMESQYMSKWMRKFNDKFFKWNGMETWNERMRVSAMGAGMRFLVRNKNNERYLNELGIKSSDIRELPDGKIARTQAEGLTKEQEQRVQEALFKFVDGAILRPNAAHRPVWASDPHYMLIAHLKQYTFSFQQTILKQVKKEFMNGNNMPAFILASYIPFMAASDLLRGSITGSIQNSWTLADFIADGVARSGILGTGSFATDAMKDAAMGNMPGSSFLGPAGQHAVSAFQTAMGAGGKDWSDLFMRSVPASPLFKAVT